MVANTAEIIGVWISTFASVQQMAEEKICQYNCYFMLCVCIAVYFQSFSLATGHFRIIIRQFLLSIAIGKGL